MANELLIEPVQLTGEEKELVQQVKEDKGMTLSELIVRGADCIKLLDGDLPVCERTVDERLDELRKRGRRNGADGAFTLMSLPNSHYWWAVLAVLRDSDVLDDEPWMGTSAIMKNNNLNSARLNHLLTGTLLKQGLIDQRRASAAPTKYEYRITKRGLVWLNLRIHPNYRID